MKLITAFALSTALLGAPSLHAETIDATIVAEDGAETEIPLEEVTVGMRLRVRPGGKIPVDGEVAEGLDLVAD